MAEEKEQKNIKAKRQWKWGEFFAYLALTLFALSLLLLGNYLVTDKGPWLALLGYICLLIGVIILLLLSTNAFDFFDIF